MTRILWLSRHPMLPCQLAALRAVWPDCEIVSWGGEVQDARVLRAVQQGDVQEVAIVAPLSYISRLCEGGLRPLWAQMEPCKDQPADVVVHGRGMRFTGWRRIRRLALEFDDAL